MLCPTLPRPPSPAQIQYHIQMVDRPPISASLAARCPADEASLARQHAGLPLYTHFLIIREFSSCMREAAYKVSLGYKHQRTDLAVNLLFCGIVCVATVKLHFSSGVATAAWQLASLWALQVCTSRQPWSLPSLCSRQPLSLRLHHQPGKQAGVRNVPKPWDAPGKGTSMTVLRQEQTTLCYSSTHMPAQAAFVALAIIAARCPDFWARQREPLQMAVLLFQIWLSRRNSAV